MLVGRDLHTKVSEREQQDARVRGIAHLRLPRHSQKVPIVLAERRARARHAVAAPIDWRTWADRAVVPGADATTVKIFGAVRHRWRPFADDRPELVVVETGEGSCVVA